MLLKKWMTICCMVACVCTSAQTDSSRLIDRRLDSAYISQVEDRKLPAKILHAEPLYIDLIRDLGARKGEKEWNFGFGLSDNFNYDTYTVLAEYEFAPVDRLGLEIELPFTITSPQKGMERDDIPASRLESLKLAAQYTFLVDEKHKTSIALGYIHEFELSDFDHFGKPLLHGNVFNPFFVAAKRWGNNFHMLIYTGPRIQQPVNHGETIFRYDINTNFHYMVPGTRNFVGLEVNKNIHRKDFDMTLRPQMRLGLSDNILAGIVGGVPIDRENQRFSMFLRIIWEPGH